jgi:hypothetical protein
MTSGMDIAMNVSQQGRALTGNADEPFIQWIRARQCGVDLLSRVRQRCPEVRIGPRMRISS